MSSVVFKSAPKWAPIAVYRAFGLHELPDRHKSMQALCRDIAEKTLKPKAAELDREQKFPSDTLAEIVSQGLMGVNVGPKYGGLGLDNLTLSIVVEEISRGCAGTGTIVSVHNCLYANLVDRVGTEEQKKIFLAPYTAGTVGAFALSESDAGSDVGAIATTATLEGDCWVLNGTKAWVTSAHEAKAGVIFATVNKLERYRGITAFLVPIPSPGLTLCKKEDKLGIRASSTSDIVLEDVRIPKSNILGEVGAGFKMAMVQLEQARIGIASQALGIAQAALDTALKYAGTMKTPDGTYVCDEQAVQIKLAEMATKLEAARLLTWKAATLRDNNESSSKCSSMAKLAASECATFAAHSAVQILGQDGCISDFAAERHYRDARITEIYGGITDIQKLVISAHLFKEFNKL